MYVTWFRENTTHGRKYRIDCDPRLDSLVMNAHAIPPEKRFIQEYLWDVITTYQMDFRSLPDGTFYISSTLPDV